MKKLLLTGIFAGLAVGAYAQGAVALDNINNTSSSPTATASGLFFLRTGAAAPVLINQDFNIVFLAGTDSASLSVLASFVGSAASGGNGFGPGTFLDPTGGSYPINGAITTAFFEIQAWTGPATSYAAFLAAAAQGTYGVQSLPFSNPVAVPPTRRRT